MYPDLLNKPGQAIDPAADELLDMGSDLSLTLHLMRINAGMTQKRLAAETGIPADTVSPVFSSGMRRDGVPKTEKCS
jgi:hypothetical protein